MKSNRKSNLYTNSSAQVGIGTLIIFIAMVLVAAVAAAVLIQTSGTLQQKAQSTGKQATQEVSSNLIVKGIEGIRAKDSASDMASSVSLLKLKVGLNVGSSPVDVNQVVLSITDGTTTNNLIYANNDKTYGYTMHNFSTSATGAANLHDLLRSTQATPGANAKYYYTVDKIRDDDGSFTQAKPVMNTGDLATFYVSTLSDADLGFVYVGTTAVGGSQKDSGLDIGPRTGVSIVLTPESGVVTVADFVTPSSYGTKETVVLYP